MPQASLATPIGAALPPQPPMSIDDAVRAALSQRPREGRSFGNEDDMEGPRSDAPDIRAAPPAP
ncbi:MAG TPA: hypothetical protein VHX64_12555 [Caulobacteraceae bacterium]|jgi:hypothetical protein|nr:hypothetical protein [Caulobacteraceae bacterium]